MKKFFACLLVSVLAVCSLFTFVACDEVLPAGMIPSIPSNPDNPANPGGPDDSEDYGETFEGVVAEEKYDTKEEAAVAFLENEINGNTTQAEFVSLTVESTLTEAEVEELELPQEAKDGLTSVEKVSVSYRAAAVSRAALLASDEDTQEQTMYLLHYEDGSFRYFVPLPDTGEALTKSYFDSVFDVSKYLNVTYTFHSTWTEREGQTNWNAVAKINETGLSEEDIFFGTENLEQWLFNFLYEGYNLMAVKTSEYPTWSVLPLNLEPMDEAARAEFLKTTAEYVLATWFGKGVDYTYFVKTETGFALRSDKWREFLMESVDSPEDILAAQNLSVEYSVFVSDGKIVKCTRMHEYAYESFLYRGSYELICSDFGTTTFRVPDEVMNMLSGQE